MPVGDTFILGPSSSAGARSKTPDPRGSNANRFILGNLDVITAYLPNGEVDQNSTFSTCGYSPIATFITILVGIFLVLSIIIIGFRKYDGTMPLVSTNSRAISAACHVLTEDISDGYLLPVQWGVVQIKDGIGHVALTTAHLMKTVETNLNYM